MKQITLISHYNGIKLNLRVSDNTYNALRQMVYDPSMGGTEEFQRGAEAMRKINHDAERILQGYEPLLLSRGQHHKINTFFAKDNTEYFDEVEFSPSSHFIDLGLPSGTQWAVENAVMDGKTHFSFEEAVKTFGNELPSTEAWKELFDHCKREWNEKHKGYTLTGPNGNTLFLPAAGCRRGDSLHYVGRIGYYWSSSADSEFDARAVNFKSDYVLPQDYLSRYGGLSVRICKSK